MAENKTKPTSVSVADFVNGAEPPQRRAEAQQLIEMMERISGEPATMWGPSIIGFGRYAYTYESGHSGEAPRIAFSPRKSALTLYLGSEYPARDELLAKLGKHKKGKGCLYITKLADVDAAVLEEMIAASWRERLERYPL
ncbi:DUF1801 domain-containing protein [Sphingomonas sp. ID1715]|uniref:DUF1801 domain-containing protein n=1 Tax=Sphingomonas sp. ID1715 TaxID=1656898 RepID=UPI0014889E3C|nr:DUF1801 domain-containing protein [Sphingomonas sp. ID1715]NNM78223.1 DUF1801 domain-containing protein [Sphingomonas sp. ID1715]